MDNTKSKPASSALRLSDYDYELPQELIAQEPCHPRDAARLLVLDKKSGRMENVRFRDLASFLEPGDLVVLNDSKVFPARLKGKKPTGGEIEVFLHKQLDERSWECLLRGHIHAGLEIELARGLRATATVDQGDGTWQVRFNLRGERFWKVIEMIGEVPLPPYIKREANRSSDKKDYQTIFAKHLGSVAAPTAGLHMTDRLLKELKQKGVIFCRLSLHVGMGTFAPVKTENVLEHKMHSEALEISSRTQRMILEAKREGRRVIALGTTACRALESLDWEKIAKEPLKKQAFSTEIFIYPGYRFKVTDALITNFHLPKSTLLMLVSALAGRTNVRRAYEAAKAHGYRFFSYGDAMFIH